MYQYFWQNRNPRSDYGYLITRIDSMDRFDVGRKVKKKQIQPTIIMDGDLIIKVFGSKWIIMLFS